MPSEEASHKPCTSHDLLFLIFCHFVLAEVAKCAKASCNTSSAFETSFPSNEQQQMLPCASFEMPLLLKNSDGKVHNVQCNCATYA